LFAIEGLETYIVVSRDPADLDLLIVFAPHRALSTLMRSSGFAGTSPRRNWATVSWFPWSWSTRCTASTGIH
jgi:hypothetical protein